MTEDNLQKEGLENDVNASTATSEGEIDAAPEQNINLENNSGEDKAATELSKLKIELDEAKDKYLRLFAEFDNFKKRTMKERLELIKTASQETIVSLLPIVDDFERAKKAAEAEHSTETFSEGVKLVYNKFVHTLESKGLKIMESTGLPFDTEKHEAITEVPMPDMTGKVIDTVEAGYYLHDKIIRYAKVVVGK